MLVPSDSCASSPRYAADHPVKAESEPLVLPTYALAVECCTDMIRAMTFRLVKRGHRDSHGDDLAGCKQPVCCAGLSAFGQLQTFRLLTKSRCQARIVFSGSLLSGPPDK